MNTSDSYIGSVIKNNLKVQYSNNNNIVFRVIENIM